MENITYNDIQTEVGRYAKDYREQNHVPGLPTSEDLQPYKDRLEDEFPNIVSRVKEHIGQYESEKGHDYDHLVFVATLGAWIAQEEFSVRNIPRERQERLLDGILLTGLMHDVERHLGYGKEHMVQGAKVATTILQDAGLDYPEVIEVVGNHDVINYKAESEDVDFIYSCIFDADHFRYGLEREDTFWVMKQNGGKSLQDLIHDYEFLNLYTSSWQTEYGRKVGPQFIEFGLAIAKHIEKVFS